MKVNLVWLDPKGDRILDRLARMLADGNGWSLHDRPREGVDLNYSLLYVDFAQRFTDWRKTKWAAYFSHYEPDTPYKVFWWQTAEPLIDIKTVTAQQYGDMLSGKVIKVTPPVDPMFQIRDRKPNPKPRIGTSGFVAPGGRKGEGMLARLAGDLEGKADVVASGEGWPVRKVNHGIDGLVGFYNSLDLYVCTSLIEGIPMPPLEALACGIPVVIPEGVGMLDELPDMDGVYRFDKGDYGDLLATVDFILNDHKQIDRQELRYAVKDYTPANWCKSHVDGFEKMLNYTVADKKTPKIRNVQKAAQISNGHLESDRHGERGVYYVAYGKPARDCAKGAIDSFKRHMPNVPVALVSDSPLGPEDVFVHNADEDIGGRAVKVKIYDLAPADWQYVMYLDADTEITADISFLFKILEDGWDMVICKNPGRFHVAREMRRSDNKDECEVTFQQLGTDELIQLNGGVFTFQRNPRTSAFFHAWYTEWKKWGKRDQAALLRALWANPLKLYVLGNQWNCITRYDSPQMSAGILHYPMTARRWRGVLHHRSDDPEAWQKVEEFERTQK